ncbi:MAG TPA: hypothetical protein VFB08_08940 [Burkholderiales bacterium]|nr:hypothetical protein [Burkholderiales bacterium]
MKPESTAKLSLRERHRAIGAILEARFSVAAFEEVRRTNATYWESPRNDMGRGIYGEAMREKQRLAKATDTQLLAEIAAAGA